MEQKNNLVLAGLILGLCLIISAGLGSYAFYKVRSLDNALATTGSTKQKITSDSVKWVSVFSRRVTEPELKTGYDLMARDLKAVLAFYKVNKIAETALNISPVFMEQQYKYNETSVNSPREYVLRQTVEYNSNDVAGVTKMSKGIDSLINQGIIFSTQSLEYYYSKLPELRITMLGQAMQDAKARAEEIAKSGGKRVGSLKAASLGVVQVLPVNSTEISDYGTYDTSSIEKEVMVTVKATFTLK